MISAPDRSRAIALIEEAVGAGARREAACAELGINERTYRRWRSHGVEGGVDGRIDAQRPPPPQRLSAEERQRILDLCHSPEFASLPPSQIVPRLADQGIYLASESSFYRVLHEADEQHHRGRARAPRQSRPPSTHRATAPLQTWSWDVSYLPSPVRGAYFYLYLILDIYSRRIVGWEVYEEERGELAADLVQRAVLAERCIGQPLVLHADNGSIQRGSTLRAKLDALGIEPSYSRPRVSDDNAFSESLFRTTKYRPEYPVEGFASLEAAREWMHAFVHWYNEEHRHSAIRFVTPAERHRGEDVEILAARKRTYEEAKRLHPRRWSGSTRNWEPIGEVWLNPERPTPPATTQKLETII